MKSRAFDLNLLLTAVALDETRSVTQAAEKLGMSQSGLSTALARLRRQFDDPMFVRSSGGMLPTPRGLSVANEARSVLNQIDEKVLNRPHFVPEETETEFRLATPDIGEMVFLPKLMEALRSSAPRATIQTAPYAPQELELAMEAGQVDIALGYLPNLKSNAFFKQRLVMHGFSCMVRAGHPATKGLTKELFSQLEHVVVEAPTRSQELVDNYFDQRNIQRNVRLRSTYYLSLPVIISSTDLIATVPTAVGRVFAALNQVVLIDPPYNIPKFPIHQHWHRRYDNDFRNRWLREQVFKLFGSGSNWRL
ncbi:MAG TPA: LysR family transcriptional regulator [Pusillimonas sp.]|jgi:DNA-binding transcriptional LysR family regulator|nr:LysR family transcriptional regulator [Pusillimonas sp.]|tara:strand:- start:23390 stop:24310 length:921 start_codon:yes stop_codon:yes gene_type:complete